MSNIPTEEFQERLCVRLGQIEDGSWLAISDKDPKFCVSGQTPEEALATAGRAFSYSETVKARASSPTCTP